jgi:hypothetical protein
MSIALRVWMGTLIIVTRDDESEAMSEYGLITMGWVVLTAETDVCVGIDLATSYFQPAV